MSDDDDRAARARKRIEDARAMVDYALSRWQRCAGQGWRAELLALHSLETQLGELGSALATGPRES